MNNNFQIESEYKLDGDQPKAVDSLVKGIENSTKNQVLLGVTGSGKTFSMANVISRTGKPALIMAHNKTLAAQLYEEMKSFFPNNAVEYFVSYYDYYQPEAYIARTDTYIEKDSSINAQLDRLRHSATRSLFERKDVIIVSSISCIYGLGSPETYSTMVLKLEVNTPISRATVIDELVNLQYERSEFEFARGKFRVRGDTVDVFPSHMEDRGWKITLAGNKVESITEFDSLTNQKTAVLDAVTLYANSHYITPQPTIRAAIENIKIELKERLEYFYSKNMIVEAQRLRQRTEYDIEMMLITGSCKGIENYSRHLTGKKAGEPPPTLFEYFPKDSLLFIDESHVTVPQIGGMYNGDRSRKTNLVEHGFRLPSALDNRPLKFDEWDYFRPNTIFVSATPGKYELAETKGECIEQIIRPTGLIDPICEVRPAEHQVDDLVSEIRRTVAKGQRVLVTTLTKKMSEKMTEYLIDIGIKVSYLHSEIHTLERIEIIKKLRKGDIDVIVGINLLREGLDIPECTLVAIMDADKEGFLRSETSLIQTIGRVARNVEGRAILYADKMTQSMKSALSETERRRNIQLEYNTKHGITPATIIKSLNESLHSAYEKDSALIELNEDAAQFNNTSQIESRIKKLRAQMLKFAKDLEFEKASKVRDEVHKLEQLLHSL